MPTIACSEIEVYAFRRRQAGPEFLMLRRAADRSLPGIWQPITGRIRARESAVRAALRELREETGLAPRRFWALETMTTFFDAAADRVRALPLFAAELRVRDSVQLSREHDRHRFVRARTAARLVLWDAQRRGLEAVQREVIRGGALARALELEVPAR